MKPAHRTEFLTVPPGASVGPPRHEGTHAMVAREILQPDPGQDRYG